MAMYRQLYLVLIFRIITIFVEGNTEEKLIRPTALLTKYKIEQSHLSRSLMPQNANVEAHLMSNGAEDPLCFDSKVPMKVIIKTDSFGSETSWNLTNSAGRSIMSVGKFAYQKNELYTHFDCVEKSDCYQFTIFDSFNDGICCQYGQGFFQLYFKNALYVNGSTFESSHTTNLCGESTPAPSVLNKSSNSPTPQPTSNPTVGPTSRLTAAPTSGQVAESTSSPTVKPPVSIVDTEPENKKTSNEDPLKGPIMARGVTMILEGLSNTLDGDEIAKFEQILANYIEKFFNEETNGDISSTNNLRENVYDVSAAIQLTSQDLVHRDGDEVVRRLQNSQNLQRRVNTVSLRLSYNQYMQFRSRIDDIQVMSIINEPFSNDSRKQAFLKYLQEGGSSTFLSISNVVMALEDEGPKSQTRQNNLMIIGCSLAATIIFILSADQMRRYLKRRNSNIDRAYKEHHNDVHQPVTTINVNKWDNEDLSTLGDNTTISKALKIDMSRHSKSTEQSFSSKGPNNRSLSSIYNDDGIGVSARSLDNSNYDDCDDKTADFSYTKAYVADSTLNPGSNSQSRISDLRNLSSSTTSKVSKEKGGLANYIGKSKSSVVINPSFQNDMSTLSSIRSSETISFGESTRHEEIINIIAPPGKLGLVIKDPFGIPMVYGIHETSCLRGTVKIGDKIIALDGQDVSFLSSIALAELIKEKDPTKARNFVLLRKKALIPMKNRSVL